MPKFIPDKNNIMLFGPGLKQAESENKVAIKIQSSIRSLCLSVDATTRYSA